MQRTVGLARSDVLGRDLARAVGPKGKGRLEAAARRRERSSATARLDDSKEKERTHEAKPQYTVVPGGTAEASAGTSSSVPPRVNSVLVTLMADLPWIVGAEPSGHDSKNAVDKGDGERVRTGEERLEREGREGRVDARVTMVTTLVAERGVSYG